ncbi:MAG: hypothetical protein ACUVWR_13880 [Anaerolineae bacterium]
MTKFGANTKSSHAANGWPTRLPLGHLRLRPVAGSVPTRYEVAEVLDLQGLREGARCRRQRLTTENADR